MMERSLVERFCLARKPRDAVSLEVGRVGLRSIWKDTIGLRRFIVSVLACHADVFCPRTLTLTHLLARRFTVCRRRQILSVVADLLAASSVSHQFFFEILVRSSFCDGGVGGRSIEVSEHHCDYCGLLLCREEGGNKPNP